MPSNQLGASMYAPPSTEGQAPSPSRPKIPKQERQARYRRLLQNKYVVDQEHERRFRKGMASALRDIVGFEKENL